MKRKGKKLLDTSRAIGTLATIFFLYNHGSVARPRTATQDCEARKPVPRCPARGWVTVIAQTSGHSQAPKASLPLKYPGESLGMPARQRQPWAFRQLRQFRHGQRRCVFLGG